MSNIQELELDLRLVILEMGSSFKGLNIYCQTKISAGPVEIYFYLVLRHHGISVFSDGPKIETGAGSDIFSNYLNISTSLMLPNRYTNSDRNQCVSKEN